MPLFTRTFQIIAGVLSVPVLGVAVIAANYQSPFLDHLVDIVNGNQTTVVASLNAPNWSFGLPLAQVAPIAVATTTGGTMASSTPLTFAIAALDGTGTSTISSTLSATTDASSTSLGAEAYQLTWSAVPGATGYAIYFGSNASSLNSYEYATSTNGAPNSFFTFASSTTGNFTGSYTKLDTTAFAVKINPLGTSYFNGGNIGIATTAPMANLDIASGTVRAIGNSTSTCNSATAGSMFYNSANSHEWGCNGTNWVKIY